MPIKDLIAEYLESLTGRYSQSTINQAKRCLKEFLIFLERLGIRNITGVKQNEITAFMVYLKINKPVKMQSVILCRVNRYFEYLRKRGKVLVNPMTSIEIPPYPERKYPKRIPSPEEINRLLKAADTETPLVLRNRAMLELLYSTGIRREEAARANWEDLDIYNGWLKVRSCKNGRERRVPVGKEALHYLNRYKNEVRLWNNDYTPEAMFTGINQGDRLKATTISAAVRKYAGKAGLGVIHAHALRHACATHMLRNGADIRYIQEMLGHKSLETTQIYTQILAQDLGAVHGKTHPRG